MLFIDEAFEAMVFIVSRLEGDQCSGGSRVGVVGVATPLFVGLGVKAQGLEAALRSFPVSNNYKAHS